jgi:hypothetical protein
MKRTNKLAVEEWIAYRDCPKDEAGYCLTYELAREVAKVVPGINARWFTPDFGALVILFRDWQRRPWLTWTPKQRQQRIKAYRKEYVEPIAVQADDPMNAPVDLLQDRNGIYQDEREIGRWFGTDTATVFVHLVDWNLPDKKLLADFKAWLRWKRPKAARPFDGRRKTTPMEELKWLAARRLLNAYGAPDLKGREGKSPLTLAVEAVLGEGKDVYFDRSAWYRAKRMADKSVEAIAADATTDPNEHERGA